MTRTYVVGDEHTTPAVPDPPPMTELLIGLAVLGLCLTVFYVGMQP